MSGVVHIFPRVVRNDACGVAANPLGRLLPTRRAHEIPQYHAVAVHEGVTITALVSALAAGGLACSNVPGRGLVIHVSGQNPERAIDDGAA